jgi:hypothetical protein
LAAFVGVVLTGFAIIAPHFMIDDIDKADPKYKMEVESMLIKLNINTDWIKLERSPIKFKLNILLFVK